MAKTNSGPSSDSKPAIVHILGLRLPLCVCSSSCRHCSLADVPVGGAVPTLATIREVYAGISELNGRTPSLCNKVHSVVMKDILDYHEAPDLVELIYGFPWNSSQDLATNARAIYQAKDRYLVRHLGRAGVKRLILTFYGYGASHDDFEGRHGSWEGKLTAIELCLESGLEVLCQHMLLRDRLDQIGKAVETIDSVSGGSCSHAFKLCTPVGRGQFVEHLRPTAADLANLPARIRRTADIPRMRSENEWVKSARSGRMRRQYLLWRRRVVGNSLPQRFFELTEDCSCSLVNELESFWQGNRTCPGREHPFLSAPVPDFFTLARRVGRRRRRVYKVNTMASIWQRRWKAMTA